MLDFTEKNFTHGELDIALSISKYSEPLLWIAYQQFLNLELTT